MVIGCLSKLYLTVLKLMRAQSVGRLSFIIGLLIVMAGCIEETPPFNTDSVVSTPSVQRVGPSDKVPASENLRPRLVTSDLKSPTISEIPHGIPKYNRKEWRHWNDEDRDCQNTRHEVLIMESLSPVKFKSDRGCQVLEGRWIDSYTGKTIHKSGDLDVDHMIPLKNAHDSGGWDWSDARKKAFANDLEDADHLIAVSSSANRQKGAKGPDKWKPSNRGYWCEYARDWIRIKANWELTVTGDEWDALQDMLETCGTNP